MNADNAARLARRQYFGAVVTIAVGSALSWWGLTRPWIQAREPMLPGTAIEGATTTVSVSGSQIAPAALAMAIVGLAGIAGTVGSSGLLRRIIGGVVALAGGVVVLAAAPFAVSQDSTAYLPDGSQEVITHAVPAITAVLGGALLIVGGAIVVLRGQNWPGLGRNYERATGDRPKDAWDALDRGLDPTVDDGDERL